MTVGPWLDRSCCRRNAIRAPRGPYAVGFPWPRPSSGRWPGRRCHASRPAGHRQSVPSSGGDRPDARPIPPGRLPALSMPPGRSGPLQRSAVAAVEWEPGSRMARRVRDGRCAGEACAGLDRRSCPSVELQRPSRHRRAHHPGRGLLLRGVQPTVEGPGRDRAPVAGPQGRAWPGPVHLAPARRTSEVAVIQGEIAYPREGHTEWWMRHPQPDEPTVEPPNQP
jgi:hypothetical protein